jgi:hypothetical protein
LTHGSLSLGSKGFLKKTIIVIILQPSLRVLSSTLRLPLLLCVDLLEPADFGPDKSKGGGDTAAVLLIVIGGGKVTSVGFGLSSLRYNTKWEKKN